MIEQTLTSPVKHNRFLLVGQKIRALVTANSAVVLAFFAAHVILAWLITKSSTIGNIHVILVLLFGVWWALINPRLERLAMVGGYIVGAEVMWRMTQASFLWEFGKYSIIALFFLALLRTGRLNGPILAFMFFCCLLPSIVLPMASVDEASLRADLSFYLSGPLSLMVSTWFFYNVQLTRADLQRIYYATLAPMISLATITLLGIITAEALRFSNNSNFATSGGFGPNQVSSTLGLGILAAFLAFHDRPIKPLLKITLLVVALFLTVQCALTFSRGGLYMAGGGVILASFFLVRDRRFLYQLIAAILAILISLNFFLLPRLEDMTEGALTRRFSNTKLTGRDRIAEADLQAFAEHPIFGVGPGQARIYRQQLFDSTAAHTEFSRLLAEHGIFGLIAIFLLLALSSQHYRRAHSPRGKALVAAMIGWSFLFMLVAAMRLAAPSFTFGLSGATVLPENRQD